MSQPKPSGFATRRVVLYFEPVNAFYRGLLRGISQYRKHQPSWLLYHKEPYSEAGRTPPLEKGDSDGMFDCGPDHTWAGRQRVPTILIEPPSRLDRCPCIVNDNMAIGKMAARYLRELRLKQFAFCGVGSEEWSKQRCAAFTAELDKSGFTVEVYLPRGARSLPWHREAAGLSEWLIALPKPVGLFCANDARAAVVSDLCMARGLKVPDEVAILGADNDEYVCLFANPPLSSIALGTEKTGYDAAALLDRMMSGQARMKGQRLAVPVTHVVARQSTDVLMVQDAQVRAAMRFIRDHANRVIQIRDVTAATSVSQRTLQDRFRAALGRSILEEITRARIEFIQQMLSGSGQSVKEIAISMGYRDAWHFARYFRRATGQTPRAFRKQCGGGTGPQTP